jgi:hypothetical protein
MNYRRISYRFGENGYRKVSEERRSEDAGNTKKTSVIAGIEQSHAIHLHFDCEKCRIFTVL